MSNASIVTDILNAINGLGESYTIRMVGLVDGVATHRVEVFGETHDFTDDEVSTGYEQAHAFILMAREERQMNAVMSVLSAHGMTEERTPSSNVEWKLVPVAADRAMIERRFDTRDWEASDYRDAGEQYEKWISAAPPPTREYVK